MVTKIEITTLFLDMNFTVLVVFSIQGKGTFSPKKRQYYAIIPIKVSFQVFLNGCRR